ncbi:MAG: hypothetical protein GQ527_04580 [Bacteroidales bacterium]|nr:hypothetical protein [Bacteroidales bacterium]
MNTKIIVIFLLIGLIHLSVTGQNSVERKIFRSLAETQGFSADSIRILYLEQKELTTIPDSVFLFRNLKRLSIKANMITEIPDEIGALSHLEYFEARDNEIASISPEIAKLQKLNTFKLYHNKLDSLPLELLQLSSLENFDISRNPLSDEALLLVFRMTQLKNLSISKLQLKKLPPEIGQLVNLDFLSIFCNQIDSLPESFKNLQKLEVFNGGNNPEIIVGKSFSELKNLRRMYWVNNRWDSLPIGLEGMNWLQDTYLNGNNFTEEEIARVKKIFVKGRLKIEN